MSDEDELLRLGDGAKTLLESEVFTKTINDLVNQSFHTFCNSAPDDPEGERPGLSSLPSPNRHRPHTTAACVCKRRDCRQGRC